VTATNRGRYVVLDGPTGSALLDSIYIVCYIVYRDQL
jgi:hypothetical protein